MKCPLDGAELLITERQGVEIDYCPNCRGVWLDRGELDKLIERAESYDKRDRSRDDDDNYDPRRDNVRGDAPRPRPAGGDLAGMVGEVLKNKMGDRNRDEYRGGDYRGDHYGRKKKKGGLLGDLFDF